MSQPKIVTICGSTRFRTEIAAANRELTLTGYIVLAPGVFGHDGDVITDEQKQDLDALHFQKIDLARWIYVVNPGGYIGESTRREIEYAQRTGKGVLALVDVGINGWPSEQQPSPSEQAAALVAAVEQARRLLHPEEVGQRASAPWNWRTVAGGGWASGPVHPTCIDVTALPNPPGSEWLCGPDCPRDDDQSRNATAPPPRVAQPCANPTVHGAHPQEIAGVHRECPGRQVPFCEPCAMGYSCPAHDPQPTAAAPQIREIDLPEAVLTPQTRPHQCQVPTCPDFGDPDFVGDLADDQRDAAHAAYERDQPACCPGPVDRGPARLHSDGCHVLTMRPERCDCYGCTDTAPSTS